MFNSKGRHIRQSQVEKLTRYSIRKVSFGAASVAVATGLFFLGGGSVQAAETAVTSENGATPVTTLKDTSPEHKEEVKEATQIKDSTKTIDETSTDVEKKSEVVRQDTEEVASVEKVSVSTTKLEEVISNLESKLEQLTESKETQSTLNQTKSLIAEAKNLLADASKTQEKVDAFTKQLSSQLFVLNSMKVNATVERKEVKNQDPRNGKEIPGKGESGFREATTANPIIPAKEGPTNNNKLGSGNNPADGVFESAKDQFGDIDFSNATEKSTKVEKQWSKSILSDETGKATTQLLTGGITYNWKEKEISNEINGWKITDANGNAGKVTAVKPEAPVADPGREADYQGKPSKVYDNQGTINRNYNNPDTPTATNPLGVHAANQNYANGVNYSGVVGTHNLPKGYYLELGKKGTKISKEYAVNGNSRVMLSAITGGAYGNMGTAGTGERVKITVYDAKTGEKIYSVRDDQGIGTKYENEHVSTPTGSGGNGDGWTEYRAIYEIPKTTTRVKVEIEALNDGTAINNSYLKNTNSTVTDGYFVGAVNLAVGTGTEMTTNVKTNGKEGRFGEDNLYKSKQKGELEFTVNSVGGVRHYGLAETEIEVPKGVDLPDNITNAKDWVW